MWCHIVVGSLSVSELAKKMTNLSGATLGDGVVIGRLMHDWGATTWQ